MGYMKYKDNHARKPTFQDQQERFKSLMENADCGWKGQMATLQEKVENICKLKKAKSLSQVFILPSDQLKSMASHSRKGCTQERLNSQDSTSLHQPDFLNPRRQSQFEYEKAALIVPLTRQIHRFSEYEVKNVESEYMIQ